MCTKMVHKDVGLDCLAHKAMQEPPALVDDTMAVVSDDKPRVSQYEGVSLSSDCQLAALPPAGLHITLRLTYMRDGAIQD